MNTKELAEAMLDGSLNYVPEDDAWTIAEEYLKLEKELRKYKDVAGDQANDEGLWFDAQTAPEAYLQRKLRELHAVIEGESE